MAPYLKIVAMLGISYGAAAGMLIYFFVPSICNPVGGGLLPGLQAPPVLPGSDPPPYSTYNCFGVATQSRMAWATEWGLFIGIVIIVLQGIKEFFELDLLTTVGAYTAFFIGLAGILFLAR